MLLVRAVVEWWIYSWKLSVASSHVCVVCVPLHRPTSNLRLRRHTGAHVRARKGSLDRRVDVGRCRSHFVLVFRAKAVAAIQVGLGRLVSR